MDGEPRLIDLSVARRLGELHELTSPVGDAVAACLAPRPADRPSADELARALEPLVDALPTPRLGRFRPSPRRRNPHQEVHR